MRSKRRRSSPTRSNDPNPVSAAGTPPKPAPARRENREDEAERHLGPYEARYDIARGYGVERPIVTT